MCKKRTFPQNLIAWSLFKFWVSQMNWYFTLFAYKQLYYLLWGVFIPCFPRKTKSEGVQEQQLSPHHSSLFYIKVCFVSNYCIISTFLPAPLKLLLWYLSNMERPNKQIYQGPVLLGHCFLECIEFSLLFPREIPHCDAVCSCK